MKKFSYITKYRFVASFFLVILFSRYAVHNAGVGMSLKKVTHGNQSDNLREVLESKKYIKI